MSGDARISGRIGIDPPIPWSELRDHPWAMPGRHHGSAIVDAVVEVDCRDVNTDEGVLSVRWGVGIVAEGGETNGYRLVDNANRIIMAFATTPDGTPRRFPGFLHVVWGGGQDVYRVVVRGGKAVEVRPQVVWPEGARDEDAVEVAS